MADDDGTEKPDPVEEEAAEITLRQIVKKAIRAIDGKSVVDPVKVAEKAMTLVPPNLIRFAAILTLRQIAREVLRKLHPTTVGGKDKDASAELADDDEPVFAGEDFSLLSVRYPKAHLNGKPQGYVLRDDMTKEDWNWNLEQLNLDGAMKLRHRSQLARWGKIIKGWSEVESG